MLVVVRVVVVTTQTRKPPEAGTSAKRRDRRPSPIPTATKHTDPNPTTANQPPKIDYSRIWVRRAGWAGPRVRDRIPGAGSDTHATSARMRFPAEMAGGG